MKIAIIGTRGIPNFYGGFEQFAEFLSQKLIKKGVEVYVYSPHTHPYQEKIWHGVNIIHKKDFESSIGTVAQFLYDLNCIWDCRKHGFDIILQLGYTSSSIWGWLLPSQSIITTNMDGLEWKRSKYSPIIQKFLKFAEYLAVRYSDYLIADSIGIQEYLRKKYKVESLYIPYGATSFVNPSFDNVEQLGLVKYQYNMLIARLEPENNVETILDGVVESNKETPFIVIGKTDTNFGAYLKNKYRTFSKIRFLNAIYDIELLNNMRFYSNLYFHGHSVGGTNPSLLEAMSSNALICAHDNIFNYSILKNNAFYFKNSKDVANTLNFQKRDYSNWIDTNYKTISETYDWDIIVDAYFEHFENILKA